MAALEAAIRRELAAGSATDWIPVQVGDLAYVFGALGEGRGLHVGFRVRQEAAISEARSVTLSGDDVQVVVLRLSGEASGAPGDDVVVSDPLGGTIRLGGEAGGGNSKDTILAEARLAEPLPDVAVRVLRTAAIEGREAASIRARLHLWGIVLLGSSILAGVGITLRAAWADLRRSRNHADLVLGVSHDLRTPAASIRALAESLSLGRVTEPDKKKRFIDSILREAERLAHLTERTLYLLRFDQGAVDLTRRNVDLGSIVEEAVDLFLQRRGAVKDPVANCSATARVGQTGVIVRWRISHDAMRAEGDAAALFQAISNILDNAWQYAVGPRLAGGGAGVRYSALGAPAQQAAAPSSEADGEGNGRGRSDLSSRDGRRMSKVSAEDGERDGVPSLVGSDAVIEITVEPAMVKTILKRRVGTNIVVVDNGIGLRSAELRRLYRRFYRAPAARLLHASGVGLGLAFCRYVIEAHGGSIRVDSEFGKGAEVTVWLPASQGENASGRG
jgi:signal transduction histidine kinase